MKQAARVMPDFLFFPSGQSAVRAALCGMLAMLALLFATHVRAASDFLEPDAAFRFSARMVDAKTVEVSYRIADGYYMYRERFAFSAEEAVLGPPNFPNGKVKFDETFGKNVETYRHAVTIRIPVTAKGVFTLNATGQGCADQGLCYPPMTEQARLSPSVMPTGAGAAPLSSAALPSTGASVDPAAQEMGRIEASLHSGRLTVIVPLFLLLGLGLSLTPCVLPMVPILSSIIVGEGSQAGRMRGFLLSAAYSLGMALVYTGLGVAAGLIGEGLSASLQNPWALTAFALLMTLLSLSMFDVYQLQMPAATQAWLSRISGRQSSGKALSAFVMGAISSLIVGPCVAAPLAGALLYISRTHNVLTGGSALFSMALGMSAPLLIVGASAGILLPRAGAWMKSVKSFFGVLMLGLALWTVAPIVPGWVPMLGWAILGITYGGSLLMRRQQRRVLKAVGLLFAVLGLAELAGVATGGHDPLAPLAFLSPQAAPTPFRRVKSVEELDALLVQAAGKPVMLDFYADWCVSCKEMEKLTFSDARVRARLADLVLLQADVTANNAQDKALLKRFGLFGPPGILFFDKTGNEMPEKRVIGYQDADTFLRTLPAAGDFPAKGHQKPDA